MEILFYPTSQIDSASMQYVVIAARYQDKWIFCRHKKCKTWDIPGGHVEPGETVLEAARRELWEETGAEDMKITPVCIYSVLKNEIKSYGMLCYADVTKLGELPSQFEMAEVRLADKLPVELTHPEIQPELFRYVQGWRNVQSNAGELWDVYDENRNLTGRLHRRGDPLSPGEYHLVVHIWMMNHKGEFLVTKRSPDKGFPNMWECTGGSALAGDDSLRAALREVKEETGLNLCQDRGERILQMRKSDYFRDVWLFRQEFDLKDAVLQPGETTDIMYADKEKILHMWHSGDFVPYDYLPELFESVGI